MPQLNRTTRPISRLATICVLTASFLSVLPASKVHSAAMIHSQFSTEIELNVVQVAKKPLSKSQMQALVRKLKSETRKLQSETKKLKQIQS